MTRTLIKDIIEVIEDAFPPRWQEDYDNTGLQVGETMRPCTGVMLCVDATPEIVIEAYEKGCNLIVSHHPIIFRPIKSLIGYDRVTRTILKAIRHEVAIYSCHTSLDNAPQGGVSWEMGRMLGLRDISTLDVTGTDGTGCGIVGNIGCGEISLNDFISKVKKTFESPMARCSDMKYAPSVVRRVALCGGAGGFLISNAIESGADVFIASDCKHNQFIDWLGHIFLMDIGHYESEKCTKEIFYRVISEKFPNFALYCSEIENNPISYL